jgi:hypothetical protein
MCHTHNQFKKQKIIWTRFLCKRLQLISVKTDQMEKVQTHRYRLKYKKLNMQIGQLWSVVHFVSKINRFAYLVFCISTVSLNLFHLMCFPKTLLSNVFASLHGKIHYKKLSKPSFNLQTVLKNLKFPKTFDVLR